MSVSSSGGRTGPSATDARSAQHSRSSQGGIPWSAPSTLQTWEQRAASEAMPKAFPRASARFAAARSSVVTRRTRIWNVALAPRTAKRTSATSAGVSAANTGPPAESSPPPNHFVACAFTRSTGNESESTCVKTRWARAVHSDTPRRAAQETVSFRAPHASGTLPGVDSSSGGRVTLRRLEGGTDSVDYDGELSTPSGEFRVQASVALADGSVQFAPSGPVAPDWLLEVARTTLRSAWHAHKAGVDWPRRLSRWRANPLG